MYTHTRLTALCPGLPGWAGTRKIKPIWILHKQETVSGSGISWAICKSAPRSRQITTPAPQLSVFFTAGSIYKTGCRGCKADFKRCLKVGMVYSRFQGAGTYPQNCSSLWRGIWIPPNTGFLGPTRVHTPNISSIGSSNRQTHRHTDHETKYERHRITTY